MVFYSYLFLIISLSFEIEIFKEIYNWIKSKIYPRSKNKKDNYEEDLKNIYGKLHNEEISEAFLKMYEKELSSNDFTDRKRAISGISEIINMAKSNNDKETIEEATRILSNQYSNEKERVLKNYINNVMILSIKNENKK